MHVLVHNKKRQLFVGQGVDKLSAVACVTPIRKRSHVRVVMNLGRPDHKQADEERKLWVPHQAHMYQLDSFLGWQLTLHNYCTTHLGILLLL